MNLRQYCIAGVIGGLTFSIHATPITKHSSPSVKKEATPCKDAPGKPCPKPPAPIFPVVSNFLPIILPLTPAKILIQPPQLGKLPKVNVDGKVRLYNFERIFDKPYHHSQKSFSLGGSLNFLTDPFLTGFRLGATYYTAQPFGFNDSNPAYQDATLPGTVVNALGQAFVQYQNTFLNVKVGDQLVITPWVGPSDTRMVPATYQGVLGTVTPITGLDITAFRLNKFKSRTSSKFNKTNLYNSINSGGTSIPGLGNEQDDGSLALGGQYKSTNKALMIQGWGYKFYDFAKMLYGELTYMVNPTGYFVPLMGIQYVRTAPDGTNILNQLHQGNVDGTGYGALIGAKIGNSEFMLGYNNIPRHHGAFKNGDLVSPYTTGYATDPLYTTSMIQGLVEKAAGSAFKMGGAYFFFDKQLMLKASYATYNTYHYIPNTNETDLDFIYAPINFFNINVNRSLSLRYRIGFLNGLVANKSFIYSRLMLEYDFA
jgi:hypothetical protein